MDIYKWLYTHLTPWWKKPWTHVRRAFWHKFEILNIVFFVSIAFFSGIYFDDIWAWLCEAWWHPVVLVAGFYFVGVLQGHFFWNKGDNPCEIDEDTGLP